MTAPEARTLSAATRALRTAFDAAFAAPVPPPPPATVALLLVRAGGEWLAVRREALAGFDRAENFTPGPGRTPAFLGLAGVRGAVVPVWSLAALLGRAPAPAAAARWFLLTAGPDGTPCAFACEAFEKTLFAPASALAAPGAATVPWAETVVPVVELAALSAEIFRRHESPPSRSPTS